MQTLWQDVSLRSANQLNVRRAVPAARELEMALPDCAHTFQQLQNLFAFHVRRKRAILPSRAGVA